MTPSPIVEKWQAALARRRNRGARFARTISRSSLDALRLQPTVPIQPRVAPNVGPQGGDPRDALARLRQLGFAYLPQDLNDDRSDFARALRMLRRNNAMIRRRFGLGWADAANVVIAEAARRGMSTLAVARAMVADLRTGTQEAS